MFGGDDSASDSGAPQGSPLGGDDTLNGVADLVGGTAIPGPGDAGYVPPPDPAVVPSDPPADEPVVDAPVPDAPAAETPVSNTPTSDAPAADSGASVDANDLLDLKQQALQQLSPLVGHLDQSPEEKFRTTMMLIQASDDQALLKDAFKAAGGISDDKTRAQALLDIINEINYFTQNKQQA